MVARRAPWGALPLTRGANPWKVFEALQQEVQSALEHFTPSQDPAIRLYSGEDAVMLEIDAPGLVAEAFEIAPAGVKLVIQFEAKSDVPEGARALLNDRVVRPTRYEVTLPFAAAADAIDAAYDKGVLRVTVKAPSPSTARVVVRAG